MIVSRLILLFFLISYIVDDQTDKIGSEMVTEYSNISDLNDLKIDLSESYSNDDIILSRKIYKDKLRGFWLGSCIANWTGLPTENRRTDFPFFMDDDFGSGKYDYVLDQNPWGADDDTDIEYVYQHAMEKYKTYELSGTQISKEWQKHIGLPKLWVSNLAALGQMQNGAISPVTSLPENNPMWDMIDAQLTTEIFGALSPGRPDVALKIAHLPIRTTAYLHSEWASEFYIIMYSLASVVDKSLTRREQVIWMAEKARERVPEWSYIADMYDFVKKDYDSNLDKDKWELTRDRIARRYQHNVTAGYQYKYPWDAGINFAASIISLLYGEGDYKKTIKIAAMCGWDSDNPTSTWGGLLGLLYGHSGLQAHFNKFNFSDEYNIERSRYNMPIPLDNFMDMSERGIRLIDDIVIKEMGGSIVKDSWIIPKMSKKILAPSIPETVIPWVTVEDSDPRWIRNGFEVQHENWNASGATLTKGYSNCRASLTFTGTAVQYYAFRSPKGGIVNVTIDGINYGEFNQENHASPYGQYYVKIFEVSDLPYGNHTIVISGDKKDTEKTIDMITIDEN